MKYTWQSTPGSFYAAHVLQLNKDGQWSHGRTALSGLGLCVEADWVRRTSSWNRVPADQAGRSKELCCGVVRTSHGRALLHPKGMALPSERGLQTFVTK